VRNLKSLSFSSSNLFDFYINSCIENKVELDIELGVICLYKNFLKEFKHKNPDYKLNVGEYLILNFFTDLIGKLIEQSLISYYNPLLNHLKYVSVKNIILDDKYFIIPYTSDYIKKRIRYHIKHSENDTGLSLKTELYLFQKFKLDINEVLANLGKLHYYKKCEMLRQPMIINRVEV
jgi:hypothetical protein